MSRETLNAFLTQLAGDPALQAWLNEVTEGASLSDAATAIIATAHKTGHSITEADLAELAEATAESDELPDEALDQVAGGMVGRHAIFEIFAGSPDYDPQWWKNLQSR